MKKLSVLVIAIVLALAGCGGDDEDDTGSNEDNPVLETPTTVAP